MAKAINPRQIDENDFPHEGSDAEKLAFCVRYAVLSPSTYNTQPWFFSIRDNVLSLYADRRYGLPVIDPEDRELTIACGAALYTLRLTIKNFGYRTTTELLPDPDDKDLLARVKIGARDVTASDEDRTLFKGITKRHINRDAFSDKTVPEDAQAKLQSAVSESDGWLHICTPTERQIIVQMLAEADHIQTGDKNFRRELASWIDSRRELSGDGLPQLNLNYSEIIKSLTPSLARRYKIEPHQTATDEQLEQGAPLLAVLGGNAGGIIEQLKVGQAFMSALLQAEALGLSVTTLNQICEVPELRLRLHDELSHPGRIHIILRIGYGGKPTYSPRRSITEIMETDGQISSSIKAIRNTGGIWNKFKALLSR